MTKCVLVDQLLPWYLRGHRVVRWSLRETYATAHRDALP
jgi:hypothetical protein